MSAQIYVSVQICACGKDTKLLSKFVIEIIIWTQKKVIIHQKWVYGISFEINT